MSERKKLSPVFSHADSRPRLHLRLAERSGAVAIGYRTRPDGLERFADTIEDAMGIALDDVSSPAVIIWSGTGEKA